MNERIEFYLAALLLEMGWEEAGIAEIKRRADEAAKNRTLYPNSGYSFMDAVERTDL